MIAPTPFFSDRGCHMRIYEEANALQKLGHKVTIATYHNGRDVKNIDTKRIINIPWYKKTEPGPSYHKIYLDFLLLMKCLRITRKEKYDVIHAHLHEGALIGWIVKKFNKIKLIFDCQDSLIKELEVHNFSKKGKLLYRILWKLEKVSYNKADRIITSTYGMKKFLEGLGYDKISVLEDGVNTELFNPKVKKANLKLPKNKKIVVYLGGLQEYKGIDNLLRAIPYVKNAHFLLMGYPGVERCEKIIGELGVWDKVTFTGKVDYFDAASYLALGDVAVSPKTLESGEANAKLYTYMAMGLPIVCFDIEDNRRILGKKGIYAKVRDVKDFGTKIEKSLKTKLNYKNDINTVTWLTRIKPIY